MEVDVVLTARNDTDKHTFISEQWQDKYTQWLKRLWSKFYTFPCVIPKNVLLASNEAVSDKGKNVHGLLQHCLISEQSAQSCVPNQEYWDITSHTTLSHSRDDGCFFPLFHSVLEINPLKTITPRRGYMCVNAGCVWSLEAIQSQRRSHVGGGGYGRQCFLCF